MMNKKNKKLPGWIILPVVGGIALLSLGGTVLSSRGSSSNNGTELQVVSAQKGNVSEVYNANGTIESENTKTYYSPVTAPVSECRAVVGHAVQSGDLLVSFDTTNLERDNQQAQLTLQSSLNNSKITKAQNAKAVDAANATSAQARKQADSLAEEVNKLAAQVDNAYTAYQENLAAAAANAPQIAELNAKITDANGKISEADAVISAYEIGYDGRQIEINEAEAAEKAGTATDVQKQILEDVKNYKSAQENKKTAQNDLNTATSELATLQVNVDDAGYTELKNQYDAKYAEWQAAYQTATAPSTETGMTSAELTNLNISDNLAELAALSPEELLQKGREGMKADMNGVIASVAIADSNSAVQGTAVFSIASLDSVRVNVEISPEDYGKFKVGTPAIITVGSNTYEGTLSGIDRIAVKNEKGNSMIGAQVHISNPDEAICIGASAKVKMTIAESKNVIVVPTETINASSDGDFVYVIENGVVKEKPVTLGTSSTTKVEITEGLKDGDQVVNDLNVTIKAGMKATAKETNKKNDN